jgi:hypothetical protein
MRGPWEYENPSCASVGGDFWFPEKANAKGVMRTLSGTSFEVQMAKSICNGCIHKSECGQWGIRHEKFGVWGGMTENDRIYQRKRLNIIVEEVGIADITAGVGNSSHQSDTST